MPQFSQVIGSGESCWPGADNSNTLAGEQGNSGILFPELAVMLSGKPFKHSDADSIIEQSPPALSLAGVNADVTAN